MSTKHLLDPELHPIVDAMPAFQFTAEGLPALRQVMAQGTELGDAEAAGVTRQEIQIPSKYGSDPAAPDVRCLVYQPNKPATNGPGYIHIHGGGYVIGQPEMSDEVNIQVCAQLGAVVVSVDYRLAPEHPIPAPLDDCYAALGWLHAHAQEFGVDPKRIGVGGESAGGGLAAALAIQARDAGKFAICHQHLTYPMLDDRTGTDSAPGDPLVGEFVWNREANKFGWDGLLGNAPRSAPQVPARADSLAGLPPTWILTAGLDLFRDEDIAYAQRLMADGVATELVVYPSACHGFQMIPGTALQQRYSADHLAALGRGLS